MTISRSLETWVAADGIAVLRYQEGCLICDVGNQLATWQGVRLNINPRALPTLFGMMTGQYGPGSQLNSDHGSHIRKKLGLHEFWTRRTHGVLEIVKGWTAEQGLAAATREDKMREWSKIKPLPGDFVPLCRALSRECPKPEAIRDS